MQSHHTRRALLGAAVLAIPVAAAAASPIAGNPHQAWDRLVAEFHRADAVRTLADQEHEAAETVYLEEHAALGERPKSPDTEYPRPISEMTIGELRDYVAPLDKQERYEAALAAWSEKTAALDARYKRDAEDRWHHAVREQADAFNALFEYPAPDRTALLFKLDLAEREYHGLGIDLDAPIARQVFADMRRFARGEA